MFEFEALRLSEMVQGVSRRVERLETQDRPEGGTAGGGTASFDDSAGDPSDVGTAALDGVSDWAARLDHVHTFPRSLMFSDAAGNPGTVGTAAVSDGVLTYAARLDHVHAFDRSGIFSDAEGDPADVAAAASDGASTYAARRNHVHSFPRTLMFSDAEGNPADVGTVSSDGVSTYAARRDHVHYSSVTGVSFLDAEGDPIPVGTAAVSDGTSAYPSRRDHAHALGTTLLTSRIQAVNANGLYLSNDGGVPGLRLEDSGEAVLTGGSVNLLGERVGVATYDDFGTANLFFHVGDLYHTTGAVRLKLGSDRTGDGVASIDLISGTVNTDFHARLNRTAGENGATLFSHRGTANLTFRALDAAAFAIDTNNTQRFTITSGGKVGIPTAGTATLKITGSMSVGGDDGGEASFVTLTNVTSGVSTGSGTVKMNGATGRNSTGWLKIYDGANARYVPFWTTITG